MTTAVYYICDECGDEIKEKEFLAAMDSDEHYHFHCVMVVAVV